MVPNILRITPIIHPMVSLLVLSASIGGMPHYTYASETSPLLAQIQTLPNTQSVNYSIHNPLGESTDIAFQPPDTMESTDPLDRPRGGGSRCSSDGTPCIDLLPLTALVPSHEHITPTAWGGTRSLFSTWGQTLSAQPTLWFYLPYGAEDVHGVKLELLSSSGDRVHYDGDVALGNTPGIWGYSLPPTVSLDVGETYRWNLLVKFDPLAPATDDLVSGRIQRVALPAQTQQQLNQALDQTSDQVSDQASAIAQAQILARSGIWYDLLTTIATAYPQDRVVWQAVWQDVLTDVGLSDIADVPLADAWTISLEEP